MMCIAKKLTCKSQNKYFLKKECRVRWIAHIVFGTAAIIFGLIFADNVNTSLWHLFKYISVAVTFWISLQGSMDFVLRQGKKVSVWFSGTNQVILGASVLLCLLAMAVSNYPLWYNLSIILVLFLYFIWDCIAISYYKKRSAFWLREYRSLRVMDIVILFTFITANLPLVALDIFPNMPDYFQSQVDANEIDAFSAGIGGVILSLQFIIYCVFSIIQGRKVRSFENGILNIQEGYNEWADIYDDHGNAIMCVERRHTSQRLNELNLQGNIIDLGCGTGFYTGAIIENPNVLSVYAIDHNSRMLGKLERNIDSDKLKVCEETVVNLSAIPDSSIDGILCCLVVDHLDKFNYPIMLREAFRVLKPNGFLYITDVNPYFQQLMQPFAKFINGRGEIRKIKVFPHTVKEVLRYFNESGFNPPSINEVLISEKDIQNWPDLGEENLLRFPLIFEYFIEKQ